MTITVHNLYYIPSGINHHAKPIICADDTNVLITANNLNDLQTKLFSTLN